MIGWALPNKFRFSGSCPTYDGSLILDSVLARTVETIVSKFGRIGMAHLFMFGGPCPPYDISIIGRVSHGHSGKLLAGIHPKKTEDGFPIKTVGNDAES